MSNDHLRIVCVGNRLEAGDVAGPLVYAHLVANGTPPPIEVIDGGLGGLDLLRWIEGARRLVFVDTVVGFSDTDGLVVLRGDEVGDSADAAFGHSAGLPYLLRVAPQVLEGPLPELYVVGLQGTPTPKRIELAAGLSVELVTHGRPAALHPAVQ